METSNNNHPEEDQELFEGAANYNPPRRPPPLQSKSSTLTDLDYEQESCTDSFMVCLIWCVLIVCTLVVLVGDTVLLPRDRLTWCQAAQIDIDASSSSADPRQTHQWKHYANIDAIRDPCYYERTIYLLGWSPWECDFARRMLVSVILGAAIGYERKVADRPAGIRTMSLVCLGSATFTMASQCAFRSSTMGWDAARVSAAIPSGVGFLGSALIWKESTGEKGGPNQKNHVHGITTAASVWLSASVGIGVGGALYVMSVWTVVLVIFMLRIGPRLAFLEDHDDNKSYTSSGLFQNSIGMGVNEGNTTTAETSDWDTTAGTNEEEGEEDDIVTPPATREEQFQLLKLQSQAHQQRPLGMIPKAVSYQSRLYDIRRESIRIQKKQFPAFHSD